MQTKFFYRLAETNFHAGKAARPFERFRDVACVIGDGKDAPAPFELDGQAVRFEKFDDFLGRKGIDYAR